MDRDWDPEEHGVGPPSAQCLARMAGLKVAVVGAGLAGLMAARELARWGASVTVYEARAQVGGRVLSDSTFAKGRIIEAGAELIGSIHTRWCALAKEYGLSLISRMNGDLYGGQQLVQRMIFDRLLISDEIAEIETQMANLQRRIAEFARDQILPGNESRPWNQPGLAVHDQTSVAVALKTRFGISTSGLLWRAVKLLLENNNVVPLEQMNFLGLLCLVRGGQTERRAGKPVTIARDSLMGYWQELEIYRCGDGCQRLALAIAADVVAHKGCRLLRNMGVRRIELDPVGGGVLVTARSTRNTRFDEWLREKLPANPLVGTGRYAHVILAVPPTVWGDIRITPAHPKDHIGPMGWGPAAKFFSNVKDRFWIKDGFAPLGGSLDIGHVWEGTDSQTRVRGQDIVLSVFTGSRMLSVDNYLNGLSELFPGNPNNKQSGYLRNLKGKPMLVDWSHQPFIRIGYSAPFVGQLFKVGKKLSEPFAAGRLFFAGEHTQPDHFGYMEGAIRSGERAARTLLGTVCGSPPKPVLVAAAGAQPALTT